MRRGKLQERPNSLHHLRKKSLTAVGVKTNKKVFIFSALSVATVLCHSYVGCVRVHYKMQCGQFSPVWYCYAVFNSIPIQRYHDSTLVLTQCGSNNFGESSRFKCRQAFGSAKHTLVSNIVKFLRGHIPQRALNIHG
jgi:hypothetical protein